jgi:hypothetical protein
VLCRRAVVGELDVLGQAAGDPPPAHDRDRPHGEGLGGAGLRRWVAPVLGVRQLDRADVVRRRLRPQERRADAVDPEDRARQDARVEVVEAEATGVGVDVAERVGEQVQVAVLEDADAAEVRRRDDHGAWRWKDGGSRIGAIDGRLRHGSMMPRTARGCHGENRRRMARPHRTAATACAVSADCKPFAASDSTCAKRSSS